MRPPCDLVREFLNGELADDEQRRFFEHLRTCERCPARIDQLVPPGGPIRVAPRPRWGRRVAVAMAAAVALAVVVGVLRRGGPANRRPQALGGAPASRSLDARVGPPGFDVFAPYNPPAAVRRGA